MYRRQAPIGLAIVGVGWAGRRQAQAIAELNIQDQDGVAGRLELVMLVDSDRDHVATEAQSLGVSEWTTEIEEALSNPDIQAVSIATPHALHAGQAIVSVRAGKHTMVEKPMATDVSEATDMIRAAEDSRVCLFVAESAVYSPMVTLVKEVLPDIGEPLYASVRRGFRPEGKYQYPGRRGWLTVPNKGGTGPWALNGIHTVAQLRAILGEVEQLTMREHHGVNFQTPEIEGTMVGLLMMTNGAPVHMLLSCELPLGRSIEIQGDKGRLVAMEDRLDITDSGGQRDLLYERQALSPYAMELLAFADNIQNLKVGPTDGISERRSLAVVQAGYESARQRTTINLSQRFGDL